MMDGLARLSGSDDEWANNRASNDAEWAKKSVMVAHESTGMVMMMNRPTGTLMMVNRPTTNIFPIVLLLP